MMLWATRLRRLCVPPFGQRSQAFSSATSIAAIVGRLKRSTVIVESPATRNGSINEPLREDEFLRGVSEAALMCDKCFVRQLNMGLRDKRARVDAVKGRRS
jgi:hypothetical protein